ncbi:sensor histidine kinase [Allosalinactinospora lopnorensis]|uniref:sensor histidine kinase n=1 Tax=Allosalinactinospora lopnorensis TaxID=1352348 RepID=UPI000623C39D|nr:sensor histidine kinase [Allosalinactinospora lopnorensis]
MNANGTTAQESSSDDRALEHKGLVYQNLDEFLEVTVPFLHQGFEADDVVAVVNTRENNEALRESLGRDAAMVQFADASNWYRHPVRALTAYDAFIKAQGSRRIRLVAESVWWDGSTPLELVEWYRYESLVNVAFARSGARGICTYNSATAPPEVIDQARQTHPELFDGRDLVKSDEYMAPGTFSALCDREPLPPPPRSAVSMRVTATDLQAVRGFAAEHARRHGLPPDLLHSLLVSVTEVATNAIRHGLPPIELRMWSDSGDLVCEVTNSGHWHPDGIMSYTPPESASDSGFGLWGVRMLCDIVQVRAGASGTTVRLRIRI